MTARGVHLENRWRQTSKGRPSAPGSDSPAGSPEKRIMGVSSGNGRASKAQWPTGSIPVTLARGMHRAAGADA